jgi:hypothetical protein
MTVDAKAEIFIERPRRTVASVMFDPKSDKLWVGGLTNVFPMSSGLLKKGSHVERVGVFLNRAFSANLRVINEIDEYTLDISADEPFEMKLRYELAEAPGGTLANLRVQSIGENDYRQMPSAVFARNVSEAIKDDLARLKRHVELLDAD